MKAWKIFTLSLKMIFGNLPQVMKITLVPALIGFAFLIGYMAILGISTSQLSGVESGSGAIGGGAAFGGFLLMLVLVMIALWVIVAWHRFVLLAEYPTGWIPTLRFDRILSYAGHAILLGLLSFVIVLPVGLLMGVTASAAPIAGMVLMVLVILALNVIIFRLSPILPAAAIAKPLRMKEAWEATKGADGTILLLLIILSGFQFVLQFALSLLVVIPVLGLLIMPVGLLISALINVSILTTLYGHFIEGRDL
ncbi:threonine dehydratase [Roseovarius sp.]|uniref:threonine dehydratase n=1 Tax=Roseovarius sp. TaxID=1486281 RepID=UPI00262A7FA7|nr:threonine dehydratase [Roseovarius sp.]